jgi:hypothetical protein
MTTIRCHRANPGDLFGIIAVVLTTAAYCLQDERFIRETDKQWEQLRGNVCSVRDAYEMRDDSVQLLVSPPHVVQKMLLA